MIVAPNEPLKTIQKNLASILSEDYEEIKSKQKRQLQIAHGFLHQKNILTNADIHRNKRFVLNLDLENFFDSFHFGRVRGYFLKNRYFYLIRILPLWLHSLHAMVVNCRREHLLHQLLQI